MKVTSAAQAEATERQTIPPLEQVRDDVWALGLAMDGGHLPFSLLYLLRDSEGSLHVVDPGTDLDGNLETLERAVTSLGRSLADIRSITATHLHPDHLGLADGLRAVSGATLQLSAAEAAALGRLRDRSPNAADVDALAVEWGVPDDRRPELREAAGRAPDYPAPRVDRLLDDGEALDVPGFRLRGVLTPGHTPGHLCLVDDERGLVFSGDHVLPHIFAGLGLGGRTKSNALADYVASCERITAFADHEVLPGHGYRFTGLGERARDSAEHHLRRTREVEAALRADADASIWSIASQLTWTAGWSSLAGFLLFSALSQTAMHRDYVLRRA